MMDSIPRTDTKAFEAGNKNLSKLRGKLSEQMYAIMLEKGWLFVIVGFLLGRAIILSVVSPFAVAFLATIWFVHRDKSAKVMLAVLAGVLTYRVTHGVYIMLAMIVFYFFYALFNNT